MGLPTSFLSKLKLTDTFTVPFGKSVKLIVRRIRAAEFREAERKFMPRSDRAGDAHYIGLLRFGVEGVQFGKDKPADCKLTADDALQLWQHAGRLEATGACMEILFQWGIGQTSREEYLEQVRKVTESVLASPTSVPEPPAPVEIPEVEDPLAN